MRPVLIVPSLEQRFRGPAGKALRLREELQRLGHPAQVVTVGGSVDGCLALPSLRGFHGTPIPRQLAPLAGLIREADIVHIVGYRDPLGAVAAWMARRQGVPYVVEPVGMHRRRLRSQKLKGAFDRLVGGRLIRGSACLIATSRLEAQELVADGIPADRIRIRPNGVALEALLPLPPPGALRSRLKIPGRAPLVLALGRIALKKGLLHLAMALRCMPNVWGVVAGPDDRDGTLKALVEARQRLGLQGRLLVIPGGLWEGAKAQAFADADVFCLPSATENFGNAAAEAAVAGVPVVLSDQCGASEWLDPRATRIVSYGDVEGLSAALAAVLHDDDVGRAASEAAAGVAASLAWPEVTSCQVEIYSEMLAAQPHCGPGAVRRGIG